MHSFLLALQAHPDTPHPASLATVWSAGATRSVSEVGFTDSVETGVSGASARTVASLTASAFNTATTTNVTAYFEPGVVWQLQFSVFDQCGPTTVYTEVVQTPNAFLPPCCLPGYFANPAKPHGACVPDRDGRVFSLCPTGAGGAAAGSNAGPSPPSPRPTHPAETSPHEPLTTTSIATIAVGAVVAATSAFVCYVSFRKRSMRHHKAGYLHGLTTVTDDAGDDDDALFEGTGSAYEDDCAL